MDTPQATLKKGRINLLPVSLLHRHWLAPDLFLSTWALSESSRHAQEHVVQRGWFGARRLLLGYQKDDIHRDEFVDPEVLEHGARTLGGTTKLFPFGENQHYAFV